MFASEVPLHTFCHVRKGRILKFGPRQDRLSAPDSHLQPFSGRRRGAKNCSLFYLPPLLGTYRIQGDVIVHRIIVHRIKVQRIGVHRIAASLFPSSTRTVQQRVFTLQGDELVLPTPPTKEFGVTVVNEISWEPEVPI